MVPFCHTDFKPELDQVSVDTGKQCFDMDNKERLHHVWKVVFWEQKKPIMLYLYLYARCSLRNDSFCQLLFQNTYKGKLN